MPQDKAIESAQAGIDAIREDQNISGAFRACLPDVFKRLDVAREVARDIETFDSVGLRIVEVPEPEPAPGRYTAVDDYVKLGSETVGRMRSHSMAKRCARALNLQSHKI